MSTNLTIADKPWLNPVFDELLSNHVHGRLAHAMLFAGPVGLGKLELARSLAGVLVCVSPTFPKPCGECRGCGLLASGNHPDVFTIVAPEGKRVIGIDAIRELIEKMAVKSHQGGYRVLIFPELADMTFAAANSLLKLLEEPPTDTAFLCCSAKLGQLIPTIRSRLQLYRIGQPSRSSALGWLHNTHQIDRLEAENLLNLAQGAPLRVKEMLEQSFSQQRQQVGNLFMLCQQGAGGSVLTVIRNLCNYSLGSNLGLLQAFLYDLLLLHYNRDTQPTQLYFCDKAEVIADWSKTIQPRHLFKVYDQLLVIQDAWVKGIAVNQQLQLFNLAVLISLLLQEKPKQVA